MIYDNYGNPKPGEKCRESWRYRSLLQSDSINEVAERLQKAKEQLARDDGRDIGVTESKQRGVYMWSLGLLIYGRLDSLEDILDHATLETVLYHEIRGPMHLWFLPCLLPLPHTLRGEEVWGNEATLPMRHASHIWIETHKEAIRQWYRDNNDNLIWDAEQDRYILKNPTSA